MSNGYTNTYIQSEATEQIHAHHAYIRLSFAFSNFYVDVLPLWFWYISVYMVYLTMCIDHDMFSQIKCKMWQNETLQLQSKLHH